MQNRSLGRISIGCRQYPLDYTVIRETLKALSVARHAAQRATEVGAEPSLALDGDSAALPPRKLKQRYVSKELIIK